MRYASVHVRLTREEYARLAARAQAAGLSLSDLLRAALQPFVAGTSLRRPAGHGERHRSAAAGRGHDQATGATGAGEAGDAS